MEEGMPTRQLQQLGYDPLWLSSGAIDESFLQQQYEEWLTGNDPNLEHFRYQGFQRIIETKQPLSDAIIITFIELALLDSDRLMADSALFKLLQTHSLTDDQFDKLTRHPAYQAEWLKRMSKRIAMVRALYHQEVSEVELLHFVSQGDGAVHQAILDTSFDNENVLNALADQGRNKRIRHQARQILQNRRKRESKGRQ